MCVISLWDDCKMFQIASKRIGFCLSCAFTGCSVDLKSWWVFVDNKWMGYILLCINGGGFRSMHYCRFFLTVMIVTLTQSHLGDIRLLCYLFKSRVLVVASFLLSFHWSIPRSSLGVAITLICTVWFWSDTSYISALWCMRPRWYWCQVVRILRKWTERLYLCVFFE